MLISQSVKLKLMNATLTAPGQPGPLQSTAAPVATVATVAVILGCSGLWRAWQAYCFVLGTVPDANRLIHVPVCFARRLGLLAPVLKASPSAKVWTRD